MKKQVQRLTNQLKVAKMTPQSKQFRELGKSKRSVNEYDGFKLAHNHQNVTPLMTQRLGELNTSRS